MNVTVAAPVLWNISSDPVFFIGYGTLRPKTAGGQIFCVFFALFGIPLNIVFLHRVGKVLSLLCKKLGKFLYEKGMRKVIGFNYLGSYMLIFSFIFKVYADIIPYYICSHAVLGIALGEGKRHSSLAELNRQGNHRGDILRKGCILSIHLNGRHPSPFINNGESGHLIFFSRHLHQKLTLLGSTCLHL